MPVGDICRKAGISQATYFNCKKKYDGLLPTEMRRLKQLEDENSKLRKVVADLSLDKELASNIWNFHIMPNAIETATRHTYRCDPWRRACLRSRVVRT